MYLDNLQILCHLISSIRDSVDGYGRKGGGKSECVAAVGQWVCLLSGVDGETLSLRARCHNRLPSPNCRRNQRKKRVAYQVEERGARGSPSHLGSTFLVFRHNMKSPILRKDIPPCLELRGLCKKPLSNGVFVQTGSEGQCSNNLTHFAIPSISHSTALLVDRHSGVLSTK